jgi:hypothetical protein
MTQPVSTAAPAPSVYTIVVQPERGGTQADRDLRAVLKRLLRTHRLRCLSITEGKQQ